MRQGTNSKRPRGKGGNRGANGARNSLTRSYDSNGPGCRVRGNPHQVHEKYLSLARDAQADDPVLAENLLQHADHYFRLILEANGGRPRQDNRDNGHDDMRRDDDGEDYGAEDDEGFSNQQADSRGNFDGNRYADSERDDGDRDRGDRDQERNRGRDNDRNNGRNDRQAYRQNNDRQHNGQNNDRQQDRQNNRQNDRQNDRAHDRQPVAERAREEPAPRPVENADHHGGNGREHGNAASPVEAAAQTVAAPTPAADGEVIAVKRTRRPRKPKVEAADGDVATTDAV